MKDVALVCVPWSSIEMPSIALGILKSVLESENISTDVYNLNVKLLKYIDKSVYQEISGSSIPISEWVFSQYLYNKDFLQGKSINFKSLIETTLDVDHHMFMYLKKKSAVMQQLICEKIPCFIDECVNTIDWGSYKLIGFTCAHGNQLAALVLSKRIKERFPDVKIVFGGPNVRGITAEEIMKCYEWVDYIIDGEGEKSLPELAKNVLEGKFSEEIPGVLFRKDGICIRSEGVFERVPLDEIPMPDYSDFFNEIKDSGLDGIMSDVRVTFESSRGCWWGEKCQCTFCGLNNGYLMYRTKSQKNVLTELIEQSKKYNTTRFFATDLVLSSEYFETLIPEIIEKKLDFDIFYEVKATLNKSEIQLLAQSGIKFVQAGIESLNTKLLKLLRKGVSSIQNIQFLKLCNENEIYVAWNLLYRIPGEDKKSYDEIIELIPLLSHLQPPTAGMIIPIALDRFSPYFNETEKYGIVDIKPKSTYNLIYPDKKVNLSNIAYTFEFSYKDADNVVMSYVGELVSAVYEWQKAYEDNKYYLNYKLIDGNVEIQDNRSLENKKKEVEPRKYYLEELEKQVFLLCEDIHSFEDIFETVSKADTNIDREQTKIIIEKLINKKLMYEESGRYVNLAVYKK